MASEGAYDAPDTPPLYPQSDLPSGASLSTVTVTPASSIHSFGSTAHRQPKDVSGSSVQPENHAIYGSASSNYAGSRTSTSTTDSQESHGQVIFAKNANAHGAPSTRHFAILQRCRQRQR